MRGHDEQFSALVAGHALDALEPHDEHELLLHLEHCAECRDELREMRDVAAAMAYEVEDATPPAALLARIRAEMAEHPRPRAATVDVPSYAPTAPAAPRDELSRRRDRRQVRWSTRATSLVAAAAVVALLGVGGYALHVRSDRNANAAALRTDRAVLAHLDRPGSYTVQLESGGAATGAAVVDGRDVFLVTHDLGRNDPTSSIYVLWAQNPHGQMVAVTGFDVARDQNVVTHATLPAGVTRPRQFGVTHEAGRTVPKTPGSSVLGVA